MDATQQVKINGAIAEDVIIHAKAFLGNVFGAYLREVRICGKPYTPDIIIHLKMDMNFSQPFLNVLSLKYRVKQVITAYETTYEVKHIKESEERAIFKLHYFEHGLVKNNPIFFDIDALEEDSRSLHVSVQFPGIFDPLTYVKSRIFNKQFSIIPFYAKHPKSSVHMYVDEAITLIKNGWKMDHYTHNAEIWTVNIWKGYDKEGCHHTTCSLCHEDFKDTDVVFKTSCRHHFHWRCKDDTNGLKQWSVHLKKTQCPLCRKYMF